MSSSSDDGVFDAVVAATYDALHVSDPDELQRMAQTLAALSIDKTALEFAIGTGRVALPLHDLGVTVAGIELSRPMVDALRQKRPDADINVAIGDMTTTRMDNTFGLVFLVYNTIDNLTSQDAQVACFVNAAANLKPGGRFVIETLVPPLQRLPFGETLLAFDRSDDHWGMDEFDVVSQTYTSHHMHITDGQPQVIAPPFRYAWPAEMDLMARIAGMTLESRWSDWNRAPFTAISKRHISVWQKPAT